MKYSTKCVRINREVVLDNACAKNSDYTYSRYDNANREELEITIADLYNNKAVCYCLSSGMTCLTFLLQKYHDKHFIVDSHIHSEAEELLKSYRAKNIWCDFRNVDEVTKAIKQNSIVLFDSLSNPLGFTYDIQAICKVAHNVGSIVVVDNTMLTSYNCNPFDYGADVVLESLSKYGCGHGDCLGGALLCNDDISCEVALMGLNITPFNAWLIRRGLATLPLRMERVNHTTAAIAEWLKQRTEVLGYDVRAGIIVFSCGSDYEHKKFIKALNLIRYSFSFGQDNTLISDCINNVDNATCMRLCIGLEDSEDLINDLERGFKQ